jgi:hypothetical protein
MRLIARVGLALLAITLVLSGGAMVAPDAHAQARSVFINRAKLPADTLTLLEQTFQTRIPDGRYWYDHASGAWGQEGGPTLGFTVPLLPVGGPLPADISRGSTGVFINGRQLPAVDLAGLQRLTGPIMQGRYWLDHQGNAGYEGQPAIVNLRMLAQQQGLYRQGSGVGQNNADGSSSYHNSRTGIGIITDGQGGAGVFTP